MWTRQQLKERAKDDLHRSYWGLVLMALIMGFISGGSGGSAGSAGSSGGDYESLRRASGGADWGLVMGILAVIGIVLLVVILVGIALGLFVFNPLVIGAQRYFIEAAYEQKTVNDMKVIGMVFSKGRSTYLNVVKIMFFKGLYEGLWTLLFIVPGIIKAYEYRMIPYILAENPDLDMKEVFQYSKEMMDGQKWDTFVLDLSFIGWIILGVFTCALSAVFYVNPYIYMTDAELYLALKHRASGDYYDSTIGGDAYAYGNPGAYSTDSSATFV